MIFTGFNKCCYPYQKFDSVDGELRLAQILENDASVVRWMKPRLDNSVLNILMVETMSRILWLK